MVTANRIAIIPARGGSKRLPRKNIMNFGGKPLLAWSVEAALRSGVFDEVIVSTEDEEIALAARAAGASVPFLREKCTDDHVTISDVALHVLEQYSAKLGKFFETVAVLQPTCPLRTAEEVRTAIDAFEESGAPFQMSCFRYHWTNPWWAFRRQSDGKADYLFPEMIGSRSQDQPPLHGLTGAIVLARVKRFLETRSFHAEGQRFEPISWMSAIDIDDREDFEFALAVLAVRGGS
jgi:N-acylneuraminate cytidylyltransferase